MKVAFLGLGAIGAPIAAHFASSHQLTVWNRTASRSEAFAERHACRVALTPRDAVQGAEVVLTCLSRSQELESILHGDDGMLMGFAQGSLLLDCTSGDPGISRRIAESLHQVGVRFADCPVSGGVTIAEAGKLTVMVGADADVYARAVPVLQMFAQKIEHMGAVGAGHAMKAVNNALLATSVVAFAEGAAGLVKAGIDARQAVEVLNNSSGRTYFSETAVPSRVLPGTFTPSFRLSLLEKDVRIALDLLTRESIAPELLLRTGEVLRALRDELGDDVDFLEIVRHVEKRSGVEIRG